MIEVLSDSNRQYLSAIRAAVSVNQRPTAVILRDFYALHWNWFTDEHSQPVWTDWDYALIEAAQTIDDYMDSDGEFPWVSQDEGLRWRPVQITSFKRAVIEQRQENASKNNNDYGNSYTAEIDWAASDSQVKKKPSEWFAEQFAKREKSMNYPRPDAE